MLVRAFPATAFHHAFALSRPYPQGNVLDKKTDEAGAVSTGLKVSRDEAAPGDDGVFVRTAGGRKVNVEICMKVPARAAVP